MSRLYNDKHRALQDLFNSRNIADRVEKVALVTEVDEMAQGFI